MRLKLKDIFLTKGGFKGITGKFSSQDSIVGPTTIGKVEGAAQYRGVLQGSRIDVTLGLDVGGGLAKGPEGEDLGNLSKALDKDKLIREGGFTNKQVKYIEQEMDKIVKMVEALPPKKEKLNFSIELGDIHLNPDFEVTVRDINLDAIPITIRKPLDLNGIVLTNVSLGKEITIPLGELTVVKFDSSETENLVFEPDLVTDIGPTTARYTTEILDIKVNDINIDEMIFVQDQDHGPIDSGVGSWSKRFTFRLFYIPWPINKWVVVWIELSIEAGFHADNLHTDQLSAQDTKISDININKVRIAVELSDLVIKGIYLRSIEIARALIEQEGITPRPRPIPTREKEAK